MNLPPKRRELIDVDPFGAQHRDQLVVLGMDHVQPRRFALGPVPEAVRIDQSADLLIPRFGIDHVEFVARPADDDPAQRPDLVTSAPIRSPR